MTCDKTIRRMILMSLCLFNVFSITLYKRIINILYDMLKTTFCKDIFQKLKRE